jgi:hypothetical protein
MNQDYLPPSFIVSISSPGWTWPSTPTPTSPSMTPFGASRWIRSSPSKRISRLLPSRRIIFFSATLPDSLADLARARLAGLPPTRSSPGDNDQFGSSDHFSHPRGLEGRYSIRSSGSPIMGDPRLARSGAGAVNGQRGVLEIHLSSSLSAAEPSSSSLQTLRRVPLHLSLHRRLLCIPRIGFPRPADSTAPQDQIRLTGSAGTRAHVPVVTDVVARLVGVLVLAYALICELRR